MPVVLSPDAILATCTLLDQVGKFWARLAPIGGFPTSRSGIAYWKE